MGEEIAYENGRISDFQRLVTLTLDQVILHTVMHHSSTFSYISNFIEIKETFLDRRTDWWTFETHFIRSTWRSRPKMETRHPVDGLFGSEFPAICNHCLVMMA